jgi:hypothetical protein
MLALNEQKVALINGRGRQRHYSGASAVNSSEFTVPNNVIQLRLCSEARGNVAATVVRNWYADQTN